MAAKKRGLGRGLDALLGSSARAAPATANTATAAPPELRSVPTAEPTTDKPSAPTSTSPDGTLCSLPVDMIQRGQYQPRVDMHQESLQDLADSINSQGVVQPIVVRAIAEGRYEIIAGERRWRASQLAGLHEIPAVVRDVDDRDTIAIALIENIQREDLNPLEEARALDRLIKEFEITHEQAAESVGRSRAAVSNLLRLLDLEDGVKEFVEQGKLEMGHARAVLALSGKQQLEAARQVISRGLTVRATEGLVKSLQRPAPTKPAKASKDANIQRLETDLSDTLGARVAVRQGRGGKGKLEISYNSLDELDGILAHIN